MNWHLDASCRGALFEPHLADSMKPRFSILTLLGITAYVAVNIVALLDAESPFGYCRVYLWLFVMLWLCIPVPGKEGATLFRRTSVFAALVYMVLASCDYWVLDDEETPVPLPHNVLARLLLELIPGGDWTYLDLTLMPNVALCLGMIVGGIALWRYRIQQQRANQEKAE
jgi:hypothetical protein